MSKNRVRGWDQAGQVQWTNGTGSTVNGGSVVKLSATLFGVLVATLANGAVGVLEVAGTFRLTKASGVALAEGQLVGWDAANSRVTVDLSGGVLGRVEVAAGSSATEVLVQINRCGPRSFRLRRPVTSGEASANQCDVDVGFPVGAFATSSVIIRASLTASGGTPNTSGFAITRNPGGTAPTIVRVAASDIATGDVLELEVHETASA